MKDKSVFIFDAECGMIISRDVVSDSGQVIAKAGTTIDQGALETMSNYHILEFYVEDGVVDNSSEDNKSQEYASYYEHVRQSEDFKKFSEDYIQSIDGLKNSLNDIVVSAGKINTDELLKAPVNLLSESKTSLHLFDMLHSMREFDDSSYVHSINVALISCVIGRWLGYSEENLNTLMLGGLLHDIGKLLIPDEVLNKPGRLTAEEYTIMKTHVTLGYEKLKDQDIDGRVKEACLLHHERCDGLGYPFGLQGNRIPTIAKIISIADVYDAMTAARVYRGSMCPFEVIKGMEDEAFTRYDPAFMLPFLNNIVSSYVNNNVELSDGSLGEVIMINHHKLSRPVIACTNGEFIDLSKRHDLDIVKIM